jgi:hypothetical protein
MERIFAIVAILLGAGAIAIVIWTFRTTSQWRTAGMFAGLILAVVAINFAQAANTKRRSKGGTRESQGKY